MFNFINKLFSKPKRKFWVQTVKENDAFIFAIDSDEIAAIIVPDVTENGCVIILKSGVSITCTKWGGEDRNRNIKFFLESQ